MDEDVIIPLMGIICAVGLPVVLGIVLGYQAIKGRHEERLAMIEKGFILEEPEKKANRYPALRNGLFMIGLSLGIIVGLFMSPILPFMNDWIDLTVPTMAILFGGIAFVIYFFLSRHLQSKEKEKNAE